MKARANIDWLSDCGGCHVAIVDIHERILELVSAVSIQRCPVLTDVKDFPPADVGLLSGAIRTEHDRHTAEQMRASCKVLVAFGTCAVYGGIPGAGTLHSPDEILDLVYRRGPTTEGGVVPSRDVAPLETKVTPIDEVVEVDLYLPGCPPHPNFIFDALVALTKGRPPRARDESVCGRCRRSMDKTDVSRVRLHHEGLPRADQCFLSQGYVCLGSVTLDRCLAPCPNNGLACTGCSGPTMQVLTEPNRDVRTEVADRMSRLTAIARDEILKSIEHTAKSHYAYAMATRMIAGKPTYLMDKWVAEAEGRLS